jgi:hypothetical protein
MPRRKRERRSWRRAKNSKSKTAKRLRTSTTERTSGRKCPMYRPLFLTLLFPQIEEVAVPAVVVEKALAAVLQWVLPTEVTRL